MTADLSIRVINLKRAVERRQHFAALHAGLDFTFFDAVDGSTVPPLPGYSPGATGCALSHKALWEECVASGRPITILEDDAVLRNDFSSIRLDAAARIAPAWDIILWGWNFDSVLLTEMLPGVAMLSHFDQAAARRHLQDFRTGGGGPKWVVTLIKLHRAFGSPCYSLTPAGAAKLLQTCFPIRGQPVFFPGLNRELPEYGIDIAMNRVYAEIGAYVSIPPMALTPNFNEQSQTLPHATLQMPSRSQVIA
jgi:glycosyl transferase, family 25